MSMLQANVAQSIFEIGTNVTAAGIIIVFSMLILLVVVISVFSKAMQARKGESAPKAAAPAAPKAAAAAAPKAVAVAQSAAQDDDEIIAVIAAAVEAMYAGSGKRGVVRSVKPAAATYHKPWAVAGIYENTIAF